MTKLAGLGAGPLVDGEADVDMGGLYFLLHRLCGIHPERWRNEEAILPLSPTPIGILNAMLEAFESFTKWVENCDHL